MQLTKRQRLSLVCKELKAERYGFEVLWRDIGDNIATNRPLFNLEKKARSDRRNKNIIDNTATMAARTLASGMMAGITSPSRNWFRLTTPDPDLAEVQAVKDWLFKFTRLMNGVFLRSNLYNALATLYWEIGVYGTAAMLIEEDFDTTIRCFNIPIGTYHIANDARGNVRVFHREFSMTVRQMIERFGYSDGRARTEAPDWTKFSSRIKEAYDRKDYGMWVDVAHAVYPNEAYDPKSLRSEDKQFSSDYYELGTHEDEKFLSEKGYDYFPVLVPRWQVTGDGVWADDCPGIQALGDVKQLQFAEEMGLKALELNINPPMRAPESMRGQPSSSIPGGITYGSDIEKFAPLRDINPRLPELEEKQKMVRMRINTAFFVDVMLRITNDTRNQRATAQEIVAGQQEQYLVLGPVLQRLDKDLLDPLISITSNFLFQQYAKDPNVIPVPPDELKGQDLKTEYVSIMAQAQKSAGNGNMNQFLQIVGSVHALNPQSLDKFDGDQFIDEYSENLGISPRVVRSDDAVNEMRQQQAAAQQQAAQAQQAQAVVGAAKSLSQTNIKGDNALSAMLGRGDA